MNEKMFAWALAFKVVIAVFDSISLQGTFLFV